MDILIALTVISVGFNMFFVAVLLNRNTAKILRRYTYTKMILRAVNFKTVFDLIVFTSETFIQNAATDIYFTYKDILMEEDNVQLFKNGKIIAIKHKKEVESGLRHLNKIIFSPNVSCFVPREGLSFIADTQEALKTLFQAAENYDLLYSVAGIDSLTKLRNRHAYEVFLKERLPRLQKQNKVITLIMVDIDNFKFYNDQYGHDVGDVVIQRVAGVIKKNIKMEDFAFRFGGDEMGVLLNGDKEDAYRISSRIAKVVKEIKIDGIEHPSITLSIGIAEAANCITGKDLQKQADTVLYKMKEGGKGMVGVYEG